MCLGFEKIVVCEYMIKHMYEGGMFNVKSFPFNNGKAINKNGIEKYNIKINKRYRMPLEIMKFAQYYGLYQFRMLFDGNRFYSKSILTSSSIKFIFSDEIIHHELLYNKKYNFDYFNVLNMNNDISSVITPKHINIHYVNFLPLIRDLFINSHNINTKKFLISQFIANLTSRSRYHQIINDIYYKEKNEDGIFVTLIDYIAQDEYNKKYLKKINFDSLINSRILKYTSDETIKILFPSKNSKDYNKYYFLNEHNNLIRRVSLPTFKKLIKNKVHINYPEMFYLNKFDSQTHDFIDIINYILKNPDLKNQFLNVNKLDLNIIQKIEKNHGKIF